MKFYDEKIKELEKKIKDRDEEEKKIGANINNKEFLKKGKIAKYLNNRDFMKEKKDRIDKILKKADDDLLKETNKNKNEIKTELNNYLNQLKEEKKAYYILYGDLQKLYDNFDKLKEEFEKKKEYLIEIKSFDNKKYKEEREKINNNIKNNLKIIQSLFKPNDETKKKIEEAKKEAANYFNSLMNQKIKVTTKIETTITTDYSILGACLGVIGIGFSLGLLGSFGGMVPSVILGTGGSVLGGIWGYLIGDSLKGDGETEIETKEEYIDEDELERYKQ
jgi:Fe2+ transport system protein B